MAIKQEIYDVIIIGGGGAGLTAALNLAGNDLDIAVLSKTHPLKSHTAAAQGGINAPLGNMGEDKVEWFIYDTVKSSDYLADQDSVEVLCKNANQAVLNLEKLGVAFNKTDEGKIYQRQYGGQTLDFGQGDLARRSCGVADKTGSSIMERLFAKATSLGVNMIDNIFAEQLVIENGQIQGVLCWDLASSSLRFFGTNYIVIASGGFAGLYKTNTAANSCTGDGLALALKAGLALQDMEFIQFHPTTLALNGLLISEVARAEGGYLTNNKNERFMEQYAPNLKDLASRDVVARAIFSEIANGNGCGAEQDYVHLNVGHLGKEKLLKFLPNLYETCLNFLNIDPLKDPIPVKPSAHYTMGGIPTDSNAKVEGVKGLYAIGETASASVHGANRLGCNSLLEIIVFGKVAADHIKTNFERGNIAELDIQKYIDAFNNNLKGSEENIARQRELLASLMESNLGLVREESTMQQALDALEKIKPGALKEQSDPNHMVEFLEFKNLLEIAKIVTKSAIARKESRGAHYREDYSDRDDKNYLYHTLCDNRLELVNKDVRKITSDLAGRLKPLQRSY